MERIFPIIGLIVLAISVAQILRILAASLAKAYASWRLVFRYALRARRARHDARRTRLRLENEHRAGSRDLIRILRG